MTCPAAPRRWALAAWGLAAVAGLAAPSCYLSHSLDDDSPSAGSGPWLAYSVEVGALHEVRATQLDGLRTVTIDEATAAVHGAWSPASPRLALLSSDAADDRTISIVRFDRDGPVAERGIFLGHDFADLFWSQSGRYLAYHLRSGPLLVVDVEGPHEPIHVVSASHVELRWSPSDVLALGIRGDDAHVAIARADEGFAVRRVTLPPPIHTASLDAGSDAWSPDGRWLLFRAKDPALLGPPRSTGANRLFVTTDRGDAATLVSREITEMHPVVSHARWSPDARRVLYNDTEPAPDGPPLTRAAFVSERAGGEPMRLGPALTPYWSSSDRIVAIDRAGDHTRGVSLEIGSSGVTRAELFARPLASNAVSFSPDGRHVVLELREHPRDVVALWEVGEAAPRDVLTGEPAFVGDAAGWSPDGTRFVLVVRAGGEWIAYELSVPSGEARAIRSGVQRFGRYVSSDPEPWSPGSEAYYLMLEGRGLAVRDVRTETTHELEPRGVSMIGWQRSPSK
jgi:hypothetical protein